MMNIIRVPFTIAVIAGSLLLPLQWSHAAENKDRLPECTSEAVISAAIEAIEDMYVQVRLKDTVEKTFTDMARSLGPYAEDDLKSNERNIAKSMGYGTEHVRICASTTYEDARVVVYVLSVPNNLNKWVLLVYNFGLGRDVGAESMQRRK